LRQVGGSDAALSGRPDGRADARTDRRFGIDAQSTDPRARMRSSLF
jgi:hypothetical protein